jgi:hypothetical protein
MSPGLADVILKTVRSAIRQESSSFLKKRTKKRPRALRAQLCIVPNVSRRWRSRSTAERRATHVVAQPRCARGKVFGSFFKKEHSFEALGLRLRRRQPKFAQKTAELREFSRR